MMRLMKNGAVRQRNQAERGGRRRHGASGGKRVLSALLCGLLAFTGLSGTAKAAGDGTELTDRAEHSELDWSEYEYYRMEEVDFDAVIAGLGEIIDDTAKGREVDAIITAAEDWANEMSRNYSVAYIHSDLVADDAYWDGEVLYYDELSTNVLDKVQQMYQQIALSANTDVMHARVTEEEWQDILDYENLTEEQKELSKRETELSLEYDTLYNQSYTTQVNGKTYDGDQILDQLMNNSSLSYDQYMALLQGYAETMAQRNEALGELYLELVDVRTQLARSHGYENYADYAYDKGYDRDFTPEDLAEYREDVKNYMVPLAAQLQEVMYDDTHYENLQAFYNEPITEQECIERLRAHLPEISEALLVSLDYMLDHHLYDLSISDAKAPGGYTISICGYNAPFMFNCADGTFDDMRTLVHEFGHYNQMYYMTEDSWYYDKTDLDLAEIHSQGLEMLFLDYAEDLYGEYAEISTLYGLFNMVYACVEGVKEDAFQYAVYSDPDGLTIEKLNELYYEYCDEYGDLDYYDSAYFGDNGYLPSGQVYEWVDIPHTFQSPMYYISYSVSVAAVFELFDEILDDRANGIDIYLRLVDAEFQDSYQNTLEEVGLNNPISNPRFDVYAGDLLYAAGLAQTREADETQLTPAEEGSREDASETETEEEERGGRRGRRGENAEEDAPDGEGSSALRYALIGGSTVLLIFILAIIIVAVRSSKKRRQEAASYVPQTVSYTPQGQAYPAQGQTFSAGQTYPTPGQPGTAPGGGAGETAAGGAPASSGASAPADGEPKNNG